MAFNSAIKITAYSTKIKEVFCVKTSFCLLIYPSCIPDGFLIFNARLPGNRFFGARRPYIAQEWFLQGHCH